MRKVLFLFGRLTDDDVDWLATTGRKLQIRAGSALIRQGEPLTAVYIVLAGEFSIATSASGSEVNRRGAGEVLGEMSFVDAAAPSATVSALVDSVVLEVSRADLQRHIQQDSGFAARFYLAIATFLSDRLRAVEARNRADGSRPRHELDPSVLDTLSLAGERFDRMLRRLQVA